jgi:hypothetical protein
MNIKPLEKSCSVAREGILYLRIPLHKRRGGILQLLLKSERGLTAIGLGPQPFIRSRHTARTVPLLGLEQP